MQDPGPLFADVYIRYLSKPRRSCICPINRLRMILGPQHEIPLPVKGLHPLFSKGRSTVESYVGESMRPSILFSDNSSYER